MKRSPIFSPSPARRDPFPRIASSAAVLISLAALVFSMGGLAPADSKPPLRPQKAPHHQGARVPSAAALDKRFASLESRLRVLKAKCPIQDAVDLGTWCMQAAVYPVPTSEVGRNSFAYAAQKCVSEGGWLPTAAQLIGAAPKVDLESTTSDDPATSETSEFPEAARGIKDQREMSGDLTTTQAGGRSAGTEGVSEGARGSENLGQPNPVPQPAEPFPESLDYITVYDNHDLGGFAGGESVSTPEHFRCAFAKDFQGAKPAPVPVAR